jgi:hypothetical protein
LATFWPSPETDAGVVTVAVPSGVVAETLGVEPVDPTCTVPTDPTLTFPPSAAAVAGPTAAINATAVMRRT